MFRSSESMPIDHFLFRAGKSAPGAKEGMQKIESSLREIGRLDESFLTMGDKSVVGAHVSKKTLGISVSNQVLEKFGFQPLNKRSAGHAQVVGRNAKQREALQRMLRHEGIRISNTDQVSNLLVLGESVVKRGSLTSNVGTALHEIGHGVSRLTQSTMDRDRLSGELSGIVDSVLSGSGRAPDSGIRYIRITTDVADNFRSTYLNLMREFGREEARAESFSGLISKTTIGKDALTKIAKGGIAEKNIQETLLGGYHRLDDEHYGFRGYAERNLEDLRGSTVYDAFARHIDFDQLQRLGAVEAHGVFMGSVDYGGMSEAVAPTLRSLQQTANEHVLTNYGEDVYDRYQSLVTGSKRISAQIRGSGLASASITPEPIMERAIPAAKALMEQAAPAAKVGVLSKKTLSGILKSGETAAQIMRFK
jgi:hypothetical protein